MKTGAQPIRVGIVGAGANTRSRHIPGLLAIPGVRVVSVANRSRRSSEQVAEEFGIPTVYDDWRQLVAADDSDAIVIGTWPYLHCEAVLAALRAGKHVLTEARMAMDAAQAHRMLAAARAHPDLVTQIVPAPFTLHVDATIQEIVAGKTLGELLVVDVFAPLGTFVDRDAPLSWRQDRDKSGNNVLTLGIWYESLVRWVGEAQRVLAMGRVFVGERFDPERGARRTVEVPDHVDVLGRLACGAQLRMQVSAVTGLTPSPGIWLYGSDATLHFDIRSGALALGRRGETGLSPVEIAPQKAQGWRVEAEFIGAIRGAEPVRLTPFEDGVRYMEFTDAVAESMARGVPIDLPLSDRALACGPVRH